jgi:CRP-like cAMP-binding protein
MPGVTVKGRARRRWSILDAMSPEDLHLLETVGIESRVPAGHVLIERGQQGTGLYLIVEGTVVIEAPEGTRKLGPGAVIGERALLSAEGTRTARVRATEEVRVLAVERVSFERLCSENEGLADRISALGEDR